MGFIVFGGGGGNLERRGGGGGGGGKGKRGVMIMGMEDSGVGILGIGRVAERWWESIWVSSSSWVVRRVMLGSKVFSSSVSE